MNGSTITILVTIFTIGATTTGAIIRLSFSQGRFQGSMIEFMTATLRRLKRLEDQDDIRTRNGNQGKG